MLVSELTLVCISIGCSCQYMSLWMRIRWCELTRLLPCLLYLRLRLLALTSSWWHCNLSAVIMTLSGSMTEIRKNVCVACHYFYAFFYTEPFTYISTSFTKTPCGRLFNVICNTHVLFIQSRPKACISIRGEEKCTQKVQNIHTCRVKSMAVREREKVKYIETESKEAGTEADGFKGHRILMRGVFVSCLYPSLSSCFNNVFE